jgi:endonuclease/exonuclease/phosphatase family metal-dependent hydrolase
MTVLRVLQFNTLARGLSSGPLAPTPFPAKAVSSYGDFTLPDPDAALDWRTRRWSLLSEILKHGADLLALQEVDQYHDLFAPALHAAGYDSTFQHVRSPSRAEDYGYYTDGVVLAWRRDRFSLRTLNCARATVAGRAAIVATLEPIDDGATLAPARARLAAASAGGAAAVGGHERPAVEQRRTAAPRRPRALIVATTHLSAKSGQSREDTRDAQVAALLEELDRARAAARQRSGGEPVVLLAGDLNTDPHDVDSPQPHVAKVRAGARAHVRACVRMCVRVVCVLVTCRTRASADPGWDRTPTRHPPFHL